jgi:hypothetical protein
LIPNGTIQWGLTGREAIQTAATGVVVTAGAAAAITAAPVVAPVILGAAAFGFGYSLGRSYMNRWEEAYTNGVFNEHERIALAAIGDTVGLSGLYEGTVGRSIITDCSLSEEEQSRRLGRGLGSLATIGLAPRAAGFGARSVQFGAPNVANGSGVGGLPPQRNLSGGSPALSYDPHSPSSVSQRSINSRQAYEYAESTEAYPGSFRRPTVDDSKLRNIVNDLYRRRGKN